MGATAYGGTQRPQMYLCALTYTEQLHLTQYVFVFSQRILLRFPHRCHRQWLLLEPFSMRWSRILMFSEKHKKKLIEWLGTIDYLDTKIESSYLTMKQYIVKLWGGGRLFRWAFLMPRLRTTYTRGISYQKVGNIYNNYYKRYSLKREGSAVFANIWQGLSSLSWSKSGWI